MRMASAIRRSASRIMWSPCSSCCLAKLPEWHWLQVCEHLVALLLPVFLGQLGDVGRLDHVQAGGRFAVRIEHAERLQNRGAVGGPLLVFRHRQAHGQEAPGGINPVVALLEVAGLAGRRGSDIGQRAGLLEQRRARRAWSRNTSPTADGRSPCGRFRTPAAAGPLSWRRCAACGRRRRRPRQSPPLVCLKSFISCGVFSPILWQAPQPFMPSVIAIGCQWMVGMAFMAAHASACLPPLNCLTCVVVALAAGVRRRQSAPWRRRWWIGARPRGNRRTRPSPRNAG